MKNKQWLWILVLTALGGAIGGARDKYEHGDNDFGAMGVGALTGAVAALKNTTKKEE